MNALTANPGSAMKRNTIRQILIGTMLVAPVSLASCGVTAQSVVSSSQDREYERLEIIYRAHSATGPLFSMTPAGANAPASPEILQTAAEVFDPNPFLYLNWSQAELRIEYPHPDGRTDVARVSLHFTPVECGQECQRASWEEKREDRAETRHSRRSTFYDRWFYDFEPVARNGETYAELDLPRSELEPIVAELRAHGYFSDRGRTSDRASQLEVRLNRRWTSKEWDYEPALDALTTRVYEQGTRRTANHGAAGAETGSQSPRPKPFSRPR